MDFKKEGSYMRRILVTFVFFVSVLSFKCAYSEDNLLAVDTGYNKESVISTDKSVQKAEDDNKVLEPQEAPLAGDDSDKELEKMKTYRELIQNKQKELEVVKLDFEKTSLILKKKEAEKEIYQIGNVIPGSAEEDGSIGNGSFQDVKDVSIDSSDIKIQLLVISDNLKEGQISMKGVLYSFREGDSLPSKLTVEKIEISGVTLRQADGAVLKLNFMD